MLTSKRYTRDSVGALPQGVNLQQVQAALALAPSDTNNNAPAVTGILAIFFGCPVFSIIGIGPQSDLEVIIFLSTQDSSDHREHIVAATNQNWGESHRRLQSLC
jgi:hypothetical protein